jgi:hypothetical protein
MSTKIIGNVSFVCTACRHPHAIDSAALKFTEDTSPEAEEDEYIRYVSSLEKLCQSCGKPVSVQFDVWELPEGVVNYSYYSEVGLGEIQCEFNLEYFSHDDTDIAEKVTLDVESGSNQVDEEGHNELRGSLTHTDKGPKYNESPTTDGYKDEYDDEE